MGEPAASSTTSARRQASLPAAPDEGGPAYPVNLTARDGALLAALAAAAVAARLRDRLPDGRAPGIRALRALGATFVTLETSGRLLGCIGTLDAVRPLYLDATRNAARAMADPRLPAVTARQWPRLDVKVSVLSRSQRLPATDLAELLEALRPGIDGLTLTDARRRATFLPSVWRKLPDPAKFVAALLAKGGWPTVRGTIASWPEGIDVRRYTATEFTDPAPRAEESWA